MPFEWINSNWHVFPQCSKASWEMGWGDTSCRKLCACRELGDDSHGFAKSGHCKVCLIGRASLEFMVSNKLQNSKPCHDGNHVLFGLMEIWCWVFLLCQNAALEQNKKVPVHSREAKRLSGILGWKIQSQLEAAHRAGSSLRLVWSCPSQLCLKWSLLLIGLRSFPLQSLAKDDPAVIIQEELNTGIV